jgi:endoglucanase Acf2
LSDGLTQFNYGYVIFQIVSSSHVDESWMDENLIDGNELLVRIIVEGFFDPEEGDVSQLISATIRLQLP